MTETTTAASTPWWQAMIAGIAAFPVGLLLLISPGILLFNPFIGALLLPLLLGIFGVVGGALAAIRTFVSRHQQAPVQPPGAQPA